ncbi:hypothetical protein D3C73_1630160 [compost metagenome]
MDGFGHFIHSYSYLGGRMGLGFHAAGGFLHQSGDILHSLAVLAGAGGQLLTGSGELA